MLAKPALVSYDFSNRPITELGGLAAFTRMAHHLGVHQSLSRMATLRMRQRKVHDSERTWELIASLGCGNSALSDLDKLAVDRAACRILGVDKPNSRRASEHLRRFTPAHLEPLRRDARAMAAKLIPAVAKHELEKEGYVPLFLDTTQIEVDGKNFEGVEKDHEGNVGYQLNAAFVGNIQVSGRLRAANAHSLKDWREHLDEDVAPLLKDVEGVWVRADNAYYSGVLVDYLYEHGWDYSISVTNDNWKRPVWERAKAYLEEADWSEIGTHEEAALIRYRPSGWTREQTYVVVRKVNPKGGELFLDHAHTVILVSRDDLDPEVLVARHRAKQGQENAFKGPLTELNLHHPRCASYMANQAYCLLALIAQIVLRAMQYLWLPKTERGHGLGYLIRHLIRVTGVLTRHARQMVVKVSRFTWRVDWFMYVGYGMRRARYKLE